MGIDFKRPRHIRGFRFGEVLVWDFGSKPLVEKTVSGSIAHIEDGADTVLIKSWNVTIAPTLDGVSEVECKQTGKNLIKIASDNYADGQKSTIEYTNSGVSVTATGTYGRSGYSFAVKTGQTYTLSFTGYSTGDYNRLYLNDKVSWSGQFKNLLLTSEEAQYSVTFTSTTDLLFIGLYVSGGGTTGTMTISNVQLEVGSSASSYEPYKAPTTYTANLGRTIYGGSADVVNGTGTDYGVKEIVSSSYLSGLSSSYIGYSSSVSAMNNHPCVWVRNFGYPTANEFVVGGIKCACNHFPVTMNNSQIISTQYRIYFDVDGKNITSVQDFIDYVSALENNNDSLEVVYQKSSPDDFTFTPITPTPETALGVNNFWADEGDSEVTYYADPDLSPTQLQSFTLMATEEQNSSTQEDNT